jgi:hypothetical protein
MCAAPAISTKPSDDSDSSQLAGRTPWGGIFPCLIRRNPCLRIGLGREAQQRLKRDEFILHHHGLAFAKSGVLNDGQQYSNCAKGGRVMPERPGDDRIDGRLPPVWWPP